MKNEKKDPSRMYKFSLLAALCLVFYSLIFPNQLIFIDKIRLSFESFIVPIVCRSLIGKEYTDKQNNPVEGPTDIKFKEINLYRNSLEPGDLLFTNNRRYLGNKFIAGKWKHAAVYVGTREKLISTFGISSPVYGFIKNHFVAGDEELIVDSSFYGVQVRELNQLFNYQEISYLQAITAFRPNIPTQKNVHFLKNVLKQINKNYDFDLLTYNTKSVYCSELLFKALGAIDIILDVPSKIGNRDVVMPTDIVRFMTNEIASADQFSFLFFLEKEKYRVVERSIEEIL